MEETIERIEQLREGIAGAAAALPEAHTALGSRAVAAADRIGAAARTDGSADPDLGTAVERFERIHWALLRVAVLGEDPGEAGLEEGVEELEREAAGASAGSAASR